MTLSSPFRRRGATYSTNPGKNAQISPQLQVHYHSSASAELRRVHSGCLYVLQATGYFCETKRPTFFPVFSALRVTALWSSSKYAKGIFAIIALLGLVPVGTNIVSTHTFLSSDSMIHHKLSIPFRAPSTSMLAHRLPHATQSL